MAGRGTLAAFLELVHRQVLELGPREHLAAERLLRAHGARWQRGELRAALASVLARNPEQWGQIARLYDEQIAAMAEGGAPQAVVLRRAELPGLLGRLRARQRGVQLAGALRNSPRALWLGAAAALIAIAVALPLAYLSRRPTADDSGGVPELAPPSAAEPGNPTEVATSSVADPEQLQQHSRLPIAGDSVGVPDVGAPTLADPKQPQGSIFVLSTVEKERVDTVVTGVYAAPPAAEPGVLAALALISALLLTLGFRFLRLAPAVRAQRTARIERRRRVTDAARRRLEESKAAAGRPLTIRYRVARHLPVGRQAMLDSAELLGRLFREERGVELDAEATLNRTVAAGGRFSPARARRHNRQEVLVLVDVEEGSHPWLEGFRRLLAAWVAQGIALRCCEFHMTPDSLVERETREPIAIDELARLAEGLPLVLFSRRLDPHARVGEARWLGRLGAWPRRAWLDPDPRRRDELSRSRRHELLRLERLGLPRFHLGDEGVVLLARWLASDGRGQAAALEPPLPPLLPPGAGDALSEALRKWALAAALVPDPTWDQLEAIRRHFPELHRVLDAPRYLQRLLEWVARETEEPAELGGGRALNVPERYQDRWLRAQRRLERALPGERGFEARARRLLLDQLGATRPDDPLDAAWWRFKRAMHRSVLEPARAAELLAWIYDSPIAHEATRWVAQELRRQAGEGIGVPRADTELLRDLAAEADSVPIAELFRGHPALWRRAAVHASGITLALLAALAALAHPVAGRFVEPEELAVRVPAVFRLVAGDPSTLPEMIVLPAGAFDMGSENGGPDALQVHRVQVAAFAITKTEVTVAQYRACVEARACLEPGEGEYCNGGRDDRDDHPINCVSWHDAQRYAGWVGARLPTEAEWEYAARSAGRERLYPWGDEPPDCERAVVQGEEGPGCSRGGTWPVCSKTAGNTEQGLCDMAGNVWEWVEDDWRLNYDRAPQNSHRAWIARPRGAFRVIRGGSWWIDPGYARVTFRGKAKRSSPFGSLGFRVARSATATF